MKNIKNKSKKTLDALILSTALISGCGGVVTTPLPPQQTPQLQYHRDINGNGTTDLIRVGDEGRVIVEVGTEYHVLFFPETPYKLTFSDQNQDGYMDISASINREGENETWVSYQMQNDRGNIYFTNTHMLRTNSSR